jgi:hypothetical protein
MALMSAYTEPDHSLTEYQECMSENFAVSDGFPAEGTTRMYEDLDDKSADPGLDNLMNCEYDSPEVEGKNRV